MTYTRIKLSIIYDSVKLSVPFWKGWTKSSFVLLVAVLWSVLMCVILHSEVDVHLEPFYELVCSPAIWPRCMTLVERLPYWSDWLLSNCLVCCTVQYFGNICYAAFELLRTCQIKKGTNVILLLYLKITVRSSVQNKS